MFDQSVVGDLRDAVATAAAADTGLASTAQKSESLRTLQAAQDALDGLFARVLSEFDEERGHDDEGSPTAAAWARRELRMTGVEARMRVKAGRTLAQLPEVREAAFAGQIRLAHVTKFTAGITKCGLGVMEAAQDWLLAVAKTCDPAELMDTINALAEVVHPDDLDEAWAKGMDKQDIKLAKTTDGFHLTGFLDILTGGQLKAWLDARSAPRDQDDDRTPSQRRIDAVGDLTSAALEHGLPTDKGIRPQLNVSCDLDTLLAAMGDGSSGASAEPLAPAELAGFGAIGSDLLSYLACMGDLTALLTNGFTTGPTPQARVLNVGRSWRLATMKQRKAVHARQGGICANPGCRHTHLEVHHVQWWSHGGPTDLHLLVGLCRRCHILIHEDKLVVKADGGGGFSFHRPTSRGKRVVDHHRTTAHAVRRRLRQLTRPPEQDRIAPTPRGRDEPLRAGRCRHCGFNPHDAPTRQRPRAPMRT